MSPLAALHQLLCQLFHGPDLRRFIWFGEQGEAISARLPGPNAPHTELVDAIVAQLQQRLLVHDTLFRLRQEFPRRAHEIDQVAAMWSVPRPQGPLPTVQLPGEQPRAHDAARERPFEDDAAVRRSQRREALDRDTWFHRLIVFGFVAVAVGVLGWSTSRLACRPSTLPGPDRPSSPLDLDLFASSAGWMRMLDAGDPWVTGVTNTLNNMKLGTYAIQSPEASFKFQLVVCADGHVDDVRTRKSTGNAQLDGLIKASLLSLTLPKPPPAILAVGCKRIPYDFSWRGGISRRPVPRLPKPP